MKTLIDYFLEHNGKLSDKWEIYLREYERAFSPFRDLPIRLLEIGVQNGGSLEVWAKYFPNATKFVGCDINPKCGSLIYPDPRVAIVVGDTTDDKVMHEIKSHSENFDLIIEDGSHASGDIIKAFANYFPVLNEGGVFVAEDLHCSYWKEFDGGLFDPYSSVSFFKALSDILNYEHWGVTRTRKQILLGFEKRYGISLSEQSLSEIHSIEFINSLCFIRKANAKKNILGSRFSAGNEELVVAGHLDLKGSFISVLQQNNNIWSTFDSAPAEQYVGLLDKKIALESEVGELELKVGELDESLEKMRNSRSWRITAPLRLVKAGFVRSSNSPLTAPLPKGNAIDESTYEITPSFEVLSGLLEENQLRSMVEDTSKVIAFYLPQYHRISENSEWWGPGFTEWTNVVKGRPNFEGHYQPHLPREFGFYDLSNVEVIREQSELAKRFGIDGFCFYYYWFSGRRILEKPLDNFLQSDIDMNYCLCWANENWTRTWDGDNKNILLEQRYLDSDPLEFIQSLLPHFNDPRYIRVNNKPMLVVYRAKEIPDVFKVFSSWRKSVEGAGFSGLHIAVVDFYDISHPDEVGADALVEFPPHKFNGPGTRPDRTPQFSNPEFKGGIVDYAKAMMQSANRERPDFTLYRGVMPGWDNTARRQNTPTILYGNTPGLFGIWLRYIRAYTRSVFLNRSDAFIFINAWNEWGEGCHLEPDQRWGMQFLDALKASTWFDQNSLTVEIAKDQLFTSAVYSIQQRGGDEDGIVISKRLQNAINQTKPMGQFAQRIAFKLRNHPFAFFIGRIIYRAYRYICVRQK